MDKIPSPKNPADIRRSLSKIHERGGGESSRDIHKVRKDNMRFTSGNQGAFQDGDYIPIDECPSSPKGSLRRDQPNEDDDYVLVGHPSSSKDSVENSREKQQWEQLRAGYRPRHNRSFFSGLYSAASPDYRHTRNMVKKADAEIRAEKDSSEMKSKIIECAKEAKEIADEMYSPHILAVQKCLHDFDGGKDTPAYKEIKDVLSDLMRQRNEKEIFLQEKLYENVKLTRQNCCQEKANIDMLYSSRIARAFREFSIPMNIPLYLK